MDPTAALSIVRLDGIHTPAPFFSPTFKHTYTSHDHTPFDDSVIIPRLKDADICITTRVPITAATLAVCPKLKLIAVLAIGVDMIDLVACREKGVIVSNVPAASNESVAEQAIALFFALRRRVVSMHELTVAGERWGKQVTLKGEFGDCPRTCRQEVVGILGGGELGNRVATICRALGMKVQFSERKGIPLSSVREGKVEFDKCLRTSTTLFVTLLLSPETLNTISKPEFALMQNDILIVNVARGGIVNEEALVQSLIDKQIGGAATDVFAEEPATLKNSPLVRAAHLWAEAGRNEAREKGKGGPLAELNGRLVLSPHIAWWARSSIEKLQVTVGANIEAWAAGAPTNVVV